MRLTTIAILTSTLVASNVSAFSQSLLDHSRRLGKDANRDEFLDTWRPFPQS